MGLGGDGNPCRYIAGGNYRGPMGVRPPAGDGDDREAVEFGIAALAPMVEEADLEFPADASTVVRDLGDPAVPVDARGRTVPLSTAIEEAGRREFASERELLNALHPVFEDRREIVSGGWLASIRRQLPF